LRRAEGARLLLCFGQYGGCCSSSFISIPPLRGNEGVAYAEVIVVARTAMGFADVNCMEVRLRAMQTKNCRMEGIARLGRT
jgi:hypothetical protein